MWFWVLTACAALCIGTLVLALISTRRRSDRLQTAVGELEARVASITEEGERDRRKLQALLERCGCGIVLLHSSGAVEAINSEAVELLDVAIADPIGKPVQDIVIGTALLEALRQARSLQTVVVAEVPRVGPATGSVSVSVAPIRGTSGPVGWLIVAHDVSSVRRLEALRRDFVANVSHELRTPMASIRAMAETLKDGALDDPSVADRFLGTIITEAERLTRISEDLLTLSDAESRPPERAEFSLTQLAELTIRRLEPQAQQSGITLTIQAPDDIRVWANRDQMEQVILNLVDNAVKYTPSGGTVTVSVTTENSNAVLTVTDTGIGILQEHLPRIFERFYRVDKARSRQSGGTGLGLSIVKNIVEAHGGRVEAQSEYNRGSVFRIEIPISPNRI